MSEPARPPDPVPSTADGTLSLPALAPAPDTPARPPQQQTLDDARLPGAGRTDAYSAPPDRPPSAGPPPGSAAAPRRSAPAAPASPQQVGDYEVLGELGRGGMGVVYRARHRALKRVVALKMVLAGGRAGPAELARFRLEAEAVARLRHPNIVQIFEVGDEAGCPWFALEFVDGGPLDRRLAATPQPPDQAAALLAVLARAVHAAHQAGIVHRDLKPANVLLARRPDAPAVGPAPLTAFEPKVTDFGLAKELEGEGQTVSGAIMGTPSYMAPEQADGRVKDVGPAADVYALCAVLYEMLVGRPPFKGASVWDTLEQVRAAEPVPPTRLQPKVPRDLETVCLKGLQKDPRQRYASAEALADDLQRYLDGRPILARPAPAWERAWKWARRRPTQAALAVAVALLFAAGAAGGAFYGLYQDQQALAARRQADGLRRELERQQGLRARVDRWQADGRSHEEAGELAQARDGYAQALAALEAEPDDATAELRRALAERHAAVVRRMEDEAGRRDALERLARFEGHLEEMSFHQISLSEQDAPAHRAAVCREAAAALGQLGLLSAGRPDRVAGGLGRLRGLLDEGRSARLAARCCLALLAWADAEAAAGDAEAARQALPLLDEAGAVAASAGLATPRALPALRARCLDALGDAAGAAAERGRLDGLPPRTAADHFRLALEDYRGGRFGPAAASCERALQAEADHFWAQYLLALCRLRSQSRGDALLRQRHLEEARASLTVCLGRRPDFLWARLLRGTALAELKEFDAAEADFAAALAGARDDAFRAAVLTNRGAARLRMGRADDAVADLGEAVRLQPKAHQGHVNLARAHQQRGDREAALKSLDRALELAPADAVLLYARGRLHLEAGHAAEARRDLEAYAAAEADGASDRLARACTDLAGLSHRAGADAAALEECDAALRARPDFADAHRQRAEALLALGRHAEAGAALDRCLAVGKPDAALWTARALVHTRLGEHAQALEAYHRAVHLQPDARTRTLRGWAYLALEAPRPALADFDAAVQAQPADADALCGRGHARALLGQTPGAVADVEEALRRGPRTPRLLLSLACVCARCVGHPATPEGERYALQERGLELLREALARVPEAERAAFWRDGVQGEPALEPLRNATGMLALARQYGR